MLSEFNEEIKGILVQIEAQGEHREHNARLLNFWLNDGIRHDSIESDCQRRTALQPL